MSIRSQKSTDINLKKTKNNIDENNPYIEFKEYIIINNITLQKENRDLREINRDLESKNLEKENEQDKYDNRARYMKGLINNLNEMNNIYKNLNKEIQKISNNIDSYNKELYKKVKVFITKYIFCILTLIIYFQLSYSIISYNELLINYVYSINYIVNIIICSTLIKIYMNNLDWYSKNDKLFNINNQNTIEKIKKLNQELQTLKESTLTLDNWICEI